MNIQIVSLYMELFAIFCVQHNFLCINGSCRFCMKLHVTKKAINSLNLGNLQDIYIFNHIYQKFQWIEFHFLYLFLCCLSLLTHTIFLKKSFLKSLCHKLKEIEFSCIKVTLVLGTLNRLNIPLISHFYIKLSPGIVLNVHFTKILFILLDNILF